MPAVLRRINRIFRRNSRERDNQQGSNNNNNSNSNNPNSSNQPQRHVNLARHMLHHRNHRNHRDNNNGHNLSLHGQGINGINGDISAPIKLRSHGYKRLSDGSVTLHVTLDKDQVECCVCLLSMTKKIYRCKGNGNGKTDGDGDNKGKVICHNICGSCEWQMRRLKSGNGHTKEMQCPMCKVKGAFIRNRALERQLAELLQSCTFNKYGCDQVFFPWDSDQKELHEKHLCMYQSVDCPFCYQSIPGGRCNFIEHLVKASKNKMIHSQQHNNNNNHAHIIQDPLDRDPNAMVQDDDDNDNNDEEEMEDVDEEMADNNDNGADTEPNDEEDDIIDDMEAESENEVDADDIVVDDEEEDEDLDETGDEEKEAVNIDDMDINEDDDEGNKNSDNYVPPCLLNWMEAGSAMDIHHNSKFLISNNRELIIKDGINQFIVSYNLGVIVCFIAPSPQTGECYSVYTISVSPRHDLGGNSRIYIQYYDDDLMNKFMEKEQNMGLITQSLIRPIQQTLILTLGRLHPTTLRKLFNSYPENNPFIAKLSSSQPIIKLKKWKSTKSEEMKENDDNDDEMRDLSPSSAINGSNNTRNRNTNNNVGNVEKKMDEEDIEKEEKTNDDDSNSNEYDEMDLFELEEHRPKDNLGDSPCTTLQCGYIFGGFGPQRMENIGIRIFTLEESLKVGSIIDARDFTGKWYQAEIISVQDFEGIEYVNLDCDNDDYLEIRRAKIHYLGYSQNYDEWLNVDTDSHRIAQRGTFTIGPDLRAIRRNTTNLNHHHSSNAHNSNNNNNASSSSSNNNANSSQSHRSQYLNRRARSSRNNHSNSNNRNHNDRSHHIIQRIPVVDIDEDEEDD